MIMQISRFYMLENVRNMGVFFGNIITPFIFVAFSFFINNALADNGDVATLIIKGQFIPLSILLLIFSFAFSSATIYLADLKADRTFYWIKRTGITYPKYYLGIALGVFSMMNIILFFVLLAYKTIVTMSFEDIFFIMIISNFVLIGLYPLSFILAGLLKNGKVANSMLVPLMLVLMFSVTMTNLFVSVSGKNPQDYYLYLIWNPMLYLNDIIQYQMGLTIGTWLPQYQYLILLSIFSVILLLIARRFFKINEG
ncbi:ABC transporter permease [Viridibacillus sp. YIM B01967]|uniref:ABC transporter permease n=1 Tax=Viridibacillus soli TaxID=2798301 RepID=A0ABS1H3E2_9BACL|nr:ABC transporter permease [Viridibacillus soli]MBK3493912.1 ABC transporter permease [Viridibacillus soli]